MFDKKKKQESKLAELSEKELQNDDIQQLMNVLQHCCCNVCGGEMTLKKINHQTDMSLEVVPYCLKCGRIKSAIDQQLYLNRINLLINDTLRLL